MYSGLPLILVTMIHSPTYASANHGNETRLYFNILFRSSLPLPLLALNCAVYNRIPHVVCITLRYPRSSAFYLMNDDDHDDGVCVSEYYDSCTQTK